MSDHPIRLLLADVDGTLVTQDKVLTDAAVAAVHRLGDAGVLFAVTSGRPPRGMAMLVDPLQLRTPIAAFNGGLLVDPDMTVIEQRVIPSDLVIPITQLMTSFDLAVWIYQGANWYVPDLSGPHVDREAWTVKFQPTVMTSVEDHTDDGGQDRGRQRRPRCRGPSLARPPTISSESTSPPLRPSRTTST